MKEYIDNTIVNNYLTEVVNTESEIEKLFRKYFFDKYSFNAIKVLKESKGEVLIKK